MASSPPLKCLRGTVRIRDDAAAALGTNINVPVAIAIYPSNIGIKPECWYQRAGGDWIEISRAGSGTAGIYEHPMAILGASETQYVCDEINRVGVKMWAVQQFQQWASDNLYNFFKPLAPVPGVQTPSGEAAKVTPDTLIGAVNAGLADFFVLLDTNGDGIPEFHGK